MIVLAALSLASCTVTQQQIASTTGVAVVTCVTFTDYLKRHPQNEDTVLQVAVVLRELAKDPTLNNAMIKRTIIESVKGLKRAELEILANAILSSIEAHTPDVATEDLAKRADIINSIAAGLECAVDNNSLRTLKSK